MNYIESIFFLLLWPLFILFSYYFVNLNLKHFKKLEKLEEYEKDEKAFNK
ncbi:hypothetical protein [Spirobacillus cienkowskii]